MTERSITKHSVSIAGHRTSLSLEPEFWRALQTLAAKNGLSVAGLIEQIDQTRARQNLSSALRVYVLNQALDGALAGHIANQDS